MMNHCGESVGFSFKATLWSPRLFCLWEVSKTNVTLSFDLLAIFTAKYNAVLLAFLSYNCFLVFFFHL